jgi:hypothetical protein
MSRLEIVIIFVGPYFLTVQWCGFYFDASILMPLFIKNSMQGLIMTRGYVTLGEPVRLQLPSPRLSKVVLEPVSVPSAARMISSVVITG